ncbi:MAG: molybdenum cofactor biosynthesis protein MoaE [Pseudomonadota bacterium]
MKVIVQQAPFDPYHVITDYQAKHLQPGRYGAVVSFVGAMRDFGEQDSVTAMILEHYAGMTEKQIEKVCNDAATQWDVLDMLVVHRYGELHPNDPIVLVAVWSTHRSDGFDACRYIINFLKQRAPFWKREIGSSGARWVESNTEDIGI